MGHAGRGPWLLLGLTALALVAACGERSNIDPDAAVSVSGRVLAADGAALSDRPVRLGSGVTVAEGGFAALTVGLSCFGGGCSGDFFDTTTDPNGTYRLDLTGKETQSTFGKATSFLLSTSATPPYTLTFLDQRGATLWKVATTDPGAAIDGRILEDGTGVAVVSTQRSDAVEGSPLEVVHHSSGVAFHGGFGPPASRGAQCGIGSGDSAVLGPCALTDGDFSPATLVPSGCGAGSEPTTTACVADRLRVALTSPVAADLAVVRGCGPTCRVAIVDGDGVTTDVNS